MFWTAVWFVVNMAFVASAIVFLFMHRAVADAVLRGAGPQRLAVLRLRRKVSGVVAVLLFIGMAASFVVNMKVNG